MGANSSRRELDSATRINKEIPIVTFERRIFDAYHETTSSRGVSMQSGAREAAALALKRRLGKWLPKLGDDILDLGCGTGGLLSLCQQTGHRSLAGVNLCREEIEIAKVAVDASFHHADLISFLRETTDLYDWIACLNVLEHLTKAEVMEVLELSASRLRPGGSLVAMVPNGLSPFSGTTRYWDITHRLSFTPNNFRQLAPLAGFRSVEFRECGPVPHGPASATRALMWQGLRLILKCRLLIEVADTKGGIYTMDMLVRMRK